MKKVSALVLCVASGVSLANEYDEAQRFALQSQAQSLQMLQSFDKNTLPNFNENPSETSLKPSNHGELESRGEQYNQVNEQAREINEQATTYQEKPLEQEVQTKAQHDYNQAENTPVSGACSDGSCIEVKPEESDDAGMGAVELGALGDMARDFRDDQSKGQSIGVFGAENIACRERWGDVIYDYCSSDGGIFRATTAEKKLHVAQDEGRALRVPGFYCSRERKKWGKRKCVEKKQFWCVFQSKLALIVQVQGRSQLGLNFGWVDYHYNASNCSGFTPEQLAQIEFDTPQMQAALNDVMAEYTSKRQLPNPSETSNRIETKVNQQRSFQ